MATVLSSGALRLVEPCVSRPVVAETVSLCCRYFFPPVSETKTIRRSFSVYRYASGFCAHFLITACHGTLTHKIYPSAPLAAPRSVPPCAGCVMCLCAHSSVGDVCAVHLCRLPPTEHRLRRRDGKSTLQPTLEKKSARIPPSFRPTSRT